MTRSATAPRRLVALPPGAAAIDAAAQEERKKRMATFGPAVEALLTTFYLPSLAGRIHEECTTMIAEEGGSFTPLEVHKMVEEFLAVRGEQIARNVFGKDEKPKE